MALPLRYSLRNIVVRRSSAALTALGIAMTVAVFAGLLSLHQGFKQLYETRGETDRVIFMRPGATSEGESGLTRQQCDILLKERPEVVRDDAGQPMGAAETYLAVYLERKGGGLTNIAVRGVQPMSITLRGDQLRLARGRWFEWGSDEVVVGRPLTESMRDCDVGDVISLNTTSFRVVGVIESDSADGGEIWGDVERMMSALQRPVFSRVIARVQPGTDIKALSEELEDDPRAPAKVQTEREYLETQTEYTGIMLKFLAILLSSVMGVAAVLGAINTMLAAVASRTHEVGVLLAIGYSRLSIFLAFLFESALMGLVGGALGLLLALPFDGIETGMQNFNTFTEVSFAFRLTPLLALQSFLLAFVLGLIGGTLPAVRAARLKPVEAFREL